MIDTQERHRQPKTAGVRKDWPVRRVLGKSTALDSGLRSVDDLVDDYRAKLNGGKYYREKGPRPDRRHQDTQTRGQVALKKMNNLENVEVVKLVGKDRGAYYVLP